VAVIQGSIAPPPSKLYDMGGSDVGLIRQNLELAQFRVETGLPLMAVSIQQSGAASDGLQRDWPVASSGVEKNYGYAVQWFGLSALITVLYVWFQIVQKFFPRR
jgi:surfeit locus 1 family protein